MKILQVSTTDRVGGAANNCWNLYNGWKSHGHDAWIAAAVKTCDDPDVHLVSEEGPRPNLSSKIKNGSGLGLWGRLQRRINNIIGLEDFTFPHSRKLVEKIGERPDIIHCHNLHGGFFDLRQLPMLSSAHPVVLTLHDSWLLAGHCAHPLTCSRWQSGCGNCPDLSIYPAISRDATRLNFLRKKNIYSSSKVYVSTPCNWLMQKVKQSILQPALIESKVIPYGVDTSVFTVGDSTASKQELGLPENSKVLLFSSFMARNNPFRDFDLLKNALQDIATSWTGPPLILLALGGEGETERFGSAEIRYLPFTDDRSLVVKAYQASDLYLHAAKMDTFPNAVLEALATGTPVVATGAGGIPEQVKGLKGLTGSDFGSFDSDRATGAVVNIGDASAFAFAMGTLAGNQQLVDKLGRNARKDAEARFSLERELSDYSAWFQDIVKNFKKRKINQ